MLTNGTVVDNFSNLAKGDAWTEARHAAYKKNTSFTLLFI